VGSGVARCWRIVLKALDSDWGTTICWDPSNGDFRTRMHTLLRSYNNDLSADSRRFLQIGSTACYFRILCRNSGDVHLRTRLYTVVRVRFEQRSQAQVGVTLAGWARAARHKTELL
jgi:hypothetical protein